MCKKKRVQWLLYQSQMTKLPKIIVAHWETWSFQLASNNKCVCKVQQCTWSIKGIQRHNGSSIIINFLLGNHATLLFLG